MRCRDLFVRSVLPVLHASFRLSSTFLLDFAACRRVSFSEASFAHLLLPVKNFFAALAVLPVLLESVKPVSHSFDFASSAFLLDFAACRRCFVDQ